MSLSPWIRFTIFLPYRFDLMVEEVGDVPRCACAISVGEQPVRVNSGMQAVDAALGADGVRPDAHPAPTHSLLKTIIPLSVKSLSAWFEHRASSMGAALAYYTIFSIAPILVISMALAGYFFGAQDAQTEVLAQLQGLIGDAGAKAVSDLVANAHYSDKKGLAAALGVVTLIVGATSVFGELQNALDRVWQTPPQKRSVGWWRFVRGRVLSIGMVFGVGFLLLVSLVASAALAAFGGWITKFMPHLDILLPVLDLILSFAMTVLLFALIYKYVPRESIPWSDVWIGASVTALLFTVGKTLIGIYIGRSSFNSAYGAAGSLIVLMLWVFYSAQIFLLGAEFTRVFAYEHGSRARLPQTSRED